MNDILNKDYINSLPQPFTVETLNGDEWPVNDIEVTCAIFRIDVCGLLQVMCMSEAMWFIDCDGVKHDPETFFCDYEVSNNE